MGTDWSLTQWKHWRTRPREGEHSGASEGLIHKKLATVAASEQGRGPLQGQQILSLYNSSNISVRSERKVHSFKHTSSSFTLSAFLTLTCCSTPATPSRCGQGGQGELFLALLGTLCASGEHGWWPLCTTPGPAARALAWAARSQGRGG